jgi:hypothetical protein
MYTSKFHSLQPENGGRNILRTLYYHITIGCHDSYWHAGDYSLLNSSYIQDMSSSKPYSLPPEAGGRKIL